MSRFHEFFNLVLYTSNKIYTCPLFLFNTLVSLFPHREKVCLSSMVVLVEVPLKDHISPTKKIWEDIHQATERIKAMRHFNFTYSNKLFMNYKLETINYKVYGQCPVMYLASLGNEGFTPL